MQGSDEHSNLFCLLIIISPYLCWSMFRDLIKLWVGWGGRSATLLQIYMMTSSNGNISALLAICAGNSPVTGEFPTQRPVTQSFDVFFDLHPNKWLSKQWWSRWFETPLCPLWRHRNDQWGGGWLCIPKKLLVLQLKYIDILPNFQFFVKSCQPRTEWLVWILKISSFIVSWTFI